MSFRGGAKIDAKNLRWEKGLIFDSPAFRTYRFLDSVFMAGFQKAEPCSGTKLLKCAQVEDDKKRQSDVESRGIGSLRIRYDGVKRDPRGVVENIVIRIWKEYETKISAFPSLNALAYTREGTFRELPVSS